MHIYTSIQSTVCWTVPIKSKKYVKRIKELGMTAGAITDHGVMFGVIDFYKEAKKAGINPVFGMRGLRGTELQI